MRSKGFRGNRKRVRRVAKKSKMSFAKRVLSVVNRRQDMKVGDQQNYNITDVREGITLANASTNQFNLLPGISCGVTESQRVGNRITLKKIVIRGYYRIQFPVGSVAGTRVLIRNLILKQRNIVDGCGIGATTQTMNYNTLLEPARSYLGGISDFNTPVNANSFIQKKQYKRIITCEYDGVATNGVGIAESYAFFNYTMTFGKGKVLNYSTTGSVSPQDFPYFMVHSATLLGSGTALPVGLVGFNFSATPYYTDD